ncbi:MAG: peptide deformylase [Candidatus Omnitrophica bacterium]|nr:peptide deformylase [Candidatus Omnitrophota bacterium]
MSARSIRQFPDPVLRKISKPVHKIDAKIEKIIKRLIDTMRRQPGGIGIAAPQIGVLKRIAIVDVSLKVRGAKPLILINPEIIRLEVEHVSREGCMSLPDYTANVRRAERVRVRWQDMELNDCELDTDGIEARCIQHEVDHLNGLLFVDRVGSLKSDVFARKVYLK